MVTGSVLTTALAAPVGSAPIGVPSLPVLPSRTASTGLVDLLASRGTSLA
ncbi:hypothetical protein [Actinomyces haliotis]|nr:hypothetical protein [Actinomyces haliotis]